MTRFRVMASSDGASRSHSLNTPNSVGLPWMRDQPHAENSTWQHTTLTRETRPCPQRDSNPKSQQPCGHWNRKKYDSNHDKSQKKEADAPVRTSHKYENMKSAVYPLLVLQRSLIVVEHVISHPAICASTIYHFICPILTLVYILHGMNLSRNRHAVANTYRSADNSIWSN
jgi:hypothetical protein